MAERIQVLEIQRPGRWWWRSHIILSFDHNLKGKTYEGIKQRFKEISIEEGEKDDKKLTIVEVRSAKDFYYDEFSNSFIDPNDERLSTEEKKFIDSMFSRFCDNLGIYKTGFVITLEVFDASYPNTIKRIKDEIVHSDPE